MEKYNAFENLTPLTQSANQMQEGFGRWTVIGNAEITHTIFGKAKIRVNRAEGKYRRVLLLAVLVAQVMAAAAWPWWEASHQTEPLQRAASPVHSRARIQVSAPVFNSEIINPADTPPPLLSEPIVPPQTESRIPAAPGESAAQQPPGSKAPGQMAAKPLIAQPLTESPPQTLALVKDNIPAKNPADMQLPPRLSAPLHPVAPGTAPTLVSRTATNGPAATIPAALPPPAGPMVKEALPASSPAGYIQPAAGISAQPQHTPDVRPYPR